MPDTVEQLLVIVFRLTRRTRPIGLRVLHSSRTQLDEKKRFLQVSNCDRKAINNNNDDDDDDDDDDKYNYNSNNNKNQLSQRDRVPFQYGVNKYLKIKEAYLYSALS